ncbi:hypothetical protein HZB02_03745 [Candidatus Woesearchaeota archaeon]|nr:hypothetical protein [Candidatus Woesearchaeota archaeon]
MRPWNKGGELNLYLRIKEGSSQSSEELKKLWKHTPLRVTTLLHANQATEYPPMLLESLSGEVTQDLEGHVDTMLREEESRQNLFIGQTNEEYTICSYDDFLATDGSIQEVMPAYNHVKTYHLAPSAAAFSPSRMKEGHDALEQLQLFWLRLGSSIRHRFLYSCNHYGMFRVSPFFPSFEKTGSNPDRPRLADLSYAQLGFGFVSQNRFYTISLKIHPDPHLAAAGEELVIGAPSPEKINERRRKALTQEWNSYLSPFVLAGTYDDQRRSYNHYEEMGSLAVGLIKPMGRFA